MIPRWVSIETARRGFRGSGPASPEINLNVVRKCCQQMFGNGWPVIFGVGTLFGGLMGTTRKIT